MTSGETKKNMRDGAAMLKVACGPTNFKNSTEGSITAIGMYKI